MNPVGVPTSDGWTPLDGVAIGCVRVGTDGRIAWANEAFGKLAGLPAGTLRRRFLADLVHPEDHEVVAGPGGTVRLLVANGETWVEVHAAPLPDGAGRLVLVEESPNGLAA